MNFPLILSLSLVFYTLLGIFDFVVYAVKSSPKRSMLPYSSIWWWTAFACAILLVHQKIVYGSFLAPIQF